MHPGARKLAQVVVGLVAVGGGFRLDELARLNQGSNLGVTFLAGALFLMIGGLVLTAYSLFVGREDIMGFVRGSRATRKAFGMLSLCACAAGMGTGVYLMASGSVSAGPFRAEVFLIAGGLFLGWWGLGLLTMRSTGVPPDGANGDRADSSKN